MIRTILLLTASNIFMTFAWYGNLKNTSLPIWKAILISWFIALFEYILMVPANRLGYVNGFNGFQLKITQEVININGQMSAMRGDREISRSLFPHPDQSRINFKSLTC